MKLSTSILASLALASFASSQNQGLTLSNLTDGYLEVPYSSSVVPQTGITFEAWITYDGSTLPTGWRYPTVCRQNTNGGQESFFLRIDAHNSNNKSLAWLVNTPSGPRRASWSFAPGQLTTWTHVAGTYDGKAARLIVNGVEVASTPASGALVDNGGVLRIGKGSDVGSPMEVWNGSIDEVRMWPFARTAGEIANTMNLELKSMPGGVSTWNLNGDYKDGSSTLHATMTGTVKWTGTPLLLAPPLPVAIVHGKGTPGCLGDIACGVSAVASQGSPDFAFVAHQLPTTAAAIALLSFGTLQAAIPFAGIDIWVDPSIGIGITVPVDSLGVARINLPVPSTVPVGAALAVQFIAVDPCGPFGLTASDANLIVIQ